MTYALSMLYAGIYVQVQVRRVRMPSLLKTQLGDTEGKVDGAVLRMGMGRRGEGGTGGGDGRWR